MSQSDTNDAGAPRLLEPEALIHSPVVSNSTMHRDRGLWGRGGYHGELNLPILEFLKEAARTQGTAAWLDLCCGSGTALVQAAERLAEGEFSARITLVGVDLMPHFAETPAALPLRLVAADLGDFQPESSFDLITCVHGLHYVGDKLGLIRRVCSWLTPNGVFTAHLDLGNVWLDGARNNRALQAELRRGGLTYDHHRRLVYRAGRRDVRFSWRYLGADPAAGPNYTGQPAVNSHYTVSS